MIFGVFGAQKIPRCPTGKDFVPRADIYVYSSSGFLRVGTNKPIREMISYEGDLSSYGDLHRGGIELSVVFVIL